MTDERNLQPPTGKETTMSEVCNQNEQGALPLVSIVTPSYNQGQYIEKTILSVLGQSYPLIQYIVMDGLSSDDTADVLDKYAHALDTVIRCRDEGQADAIDKGFRIARGKILAYLNADDCLAGPDVVSHMVQTFLDHPDADIVYGRRINILSDGRFARTDPFRSHDDEALRKTCIIPQECCFFTRRIFDRAGSYVDPSYQFAMDYELWHRFLKVGAKFLAVDHVYGLYRWHKEQKTAKHWYDTGEPEVKRLLHKHLGRVVDHLQMGREYRRHFWKVDECTHPIQARLTDELAAYYNQCKMRALGGICLDRWS